MENNDLIIIGAGGFACVVAELALDLNYNVIGFVDDTKPTGTIIYKELGVISNSSELEKNNELINCNFIIAIGNVVHRKNIYNQLIQHFNPINLIHPKATVSKTSVLNKGNIILAGAVLNANCKIGLNNIINSLSLIDHDTVIGDNCHIAQGTIIGSNVIVESDNITNIGQIIPSFSKV